MDLALALVGVTAGLTFGGLSGYRLGERVRGHRGRYWAMNVAAVLGCAILDFAGLASGTYWLAFSAIGLMAGLITGMKYGYVDSMRIWRDPGSAGVSPGEQTDLPANPPNDTPGSAAGVASADSLADPAEERADPAS